MSKDSPMQPNERPIIVPWHVAMVDLADPREVTAHHARMAELIAHGYEVQVSHIFDRNKLYVFLTPGGQRA
jgi:hypothetical protein